MKQEILDLIEIYENKEKYQQRIAEAAKEEPAPNIAEALSLQDKISFGKNRQRAEMLKQNDIFLKELSGTRNRLGENFFRLLEEEIPAPALDTPGVGFVVADDLILQSDFAEPIIVIRNLVPDEHGEGMTPIYYSPNTLEYSPGEPEFPADLEHDSFFDGPRLEVVIVDRFEKAYEQLGTPAFELRCKEEVFNRFLDKWNEFCVKWHISSNWNGELSYLHLHALPPVIIERDEENYNLPVIIRLGVWATREDVEQAWTTVEKKMKEARVYRERESENFLRDLIWFRLNKEDAMSISTIARLWARKFPKEIDLEIIDKITKDEDSFENVDMEQRLEEVLSGDKQLDELKSKFLEERAVYLRISLKEKIKKSIKKTETKVMRLGSEGWDRNRSKLLRRALFHKNGEK